MALPAKWRLRLGARAGGSVEMKRSCLYVHCRKHLPRLIRQPVARHWGTDSPLRKGGDPFGVAASHAAESGGEAT
jgi:uncharacterized protein